MALNIINEFSFLVDLGTIGLGRVVISALEFESLKILNGPCDTPCLFS